MNFKELIRRAINGNPLSEAEKNELENFDPDALREELNSTRSTLEAMENEKLSHTERLEKDLETLRQNHSRLSGEYQELQRQYRIEKLAEEFGCTDPGYFDFLARKSGIDLEDNEAVKSFATGVAERSPGCFRARISPGSAGGSTPDSTGNQPGNQNCSHDRIGRIMDSLNSANAVIQ